MCFLYCLYGAICHCREMGTSKRTHPIGIICSYFDWFVLKLSYRLDANQYVCWDQALLSVSICLCPLSRTRKWRQLTTTKNIYVHKLRISMTEWTANHLNWTPQMVHLNAINRCRQNCEYAIKYTVESDQIYTRETPWQAYRTQCRTFPMTHDIK